MPNGSKKAYCYVKNQQLQLERKSGKCLDETLNPLGKNRCSKDNECAGERYCSYNGWCQGQSGCKSFDKKNKDSLWEVLGRGIKKTFKKMHKTHMNLHDKFWNIFTDKKDR